MFEDAEVPLYPVLIKTISKRYWIASDLVKRASLVNAVKDISPFALIDLSEEDIDMMTQHYEDLHRATAVFAVEVRTAKAKVMAQTPASTEEFMLMLK